MITDDYLINPLGIQRQGDPSGQEPALMERGDHHSGVGDEHRPEESSKKKPIRPCGQGPHNV